MSGQPEPVWTDAEYRAISDMVVVLQGALRPFAEGADYYDDANLSSGEHPWRDDHPANPVFKVGQLREARRALSLSSHHHQSTHHQQEK